MLPKYAPEAIGGAELQVYYLAQELVSRGITVSYIRESDRPTTSPTKDGAVTLYRIPRIRYFFLQWLNVFHLRRVMKQVGADTYYCRVSQSYSAVVERLAHHDGANVVWACSHDREVESFKSRAGSRFKAIFEYAEHRLFVRSLRRMDVRLVQSDVQKRLLQTNYGLDSIVRENAHPLPMASDAPRTDTILWVANFRSFKRPEQFVELAKRLPYRCVMVGNIGSSQEALEFKQSIEAVSNVDYLGALDVDSVNALMSQAKVFVNTSEQEGFPNTFIQAWLRGVPVASMNVDPNGILRDFGVGLMEPDLDKLAMAIRHWVEDDSVWQPLSRRCKEFAEQRFSIVPYTDHLLSILNPI